MILLVKQFFQSSPPTMMSTARFSPLLTIGWNSMSINSNTIRNPRKKNDNCENNGTWVTHSAIVNAWSVSGSIGVNMSKILI